MIAKSRSRMFAQADASSYLRPLGRAFRGHADLVAAGDPHYQIWVSHTPAGTVIGKLKGQTRESSFR